METTFSSLEIESLESALSASVPLQAAFGGCHRTATTVLGNLDFKGTGSSNGAKGEFEVGIVRSTGSNLKIHMLTHIFTTDFRDGVTSSEATDLKAVNASGNGIQTGGGSGTQNGELLKIKPDTTDFTVTFIDGEGACGKASAGQGGGEIFIANVCLILIDVITTGFFCKEAADSEARGARATLLTP